MDNSMPMKVLHPFYQLLEHVPSHALGKALLVVLQEAVELAELSQLHHVVTQVSLSFFNHELVSVLIRMLTHGVLTKVAFVSL